MSEPLNKLAEKIVAGEGQARDTCSSFPFFHQMGRQNRLIACYWRMPLKWGTLK